MKFLVLLSLLVVSSFSQTNEYKGDTGFLSSQLADWCIGGTQYQNFCHGYLAGIYENTTCLVSRKSPSFEELKKVYIGWYFSNGDEAPISASATANLSFNEKYGCESALLDYS